MVRRFNINLYHYSCGIDEIFVVTEYQVESDALLSGWGGGGGVDKGGGANRDVILLL